VFPTHLVELAGLRPGQRQVVSRKTLRTVPSFYRLRLSEYRIILNSWIGCDRIEQQVTI